MWLDVSLLAIYVIEANGAVIEGANWLHTEHDIQHINLAELDAVL